MNQSKYLIVIPYYNHPDTLRDVVVRSLKQNKDVLVVDDGSDVTAESLLEGLDAKIVRHPQNKGKGEAILTAGHYAETHEFSHIVTLDADGQHAPEDYPKFETAIQQQPAAVYVGVRDFTANNVPGSSKFGRKFSNFWFRLQTGFSLGDCQSGFRAYPVPALTQLKYFFKSYAFEVEVLVRSAWAGLECRDIPITVYYPPEEERVSHFNKFWDNVRLTILNTHLTGRSITPWPHQKLQIGLDNKMKKEPITVLHPVRSVKRLITEHASPGQLALSAAIGIFLGALPLIALHTVSIIFTCNFFRTNKPFAISMSQFCMPPLMPAICIEVGHYMRFGRFLTEISLETLGYQAVQRIWEWLLGSLVVGPAAAIIAAGITFVIATQIKSKLDAER